MRHRLGAQDGISIVPAIALLGMLVVLGGAALQKAVGALGHSSHHYRMKRAQQAADAALEAAVHALNRADLGGALEVDPLEPYKVVDQNCVVSTGQVGGDVELVDLPLTGPTDGQGRRWCPATTPESGGQESWSYRVSQLVRVGSGGCSVDSTLSLDREVVAVGVAGDVRRRIKVRLRASLALLSGAAVQAGSSAGSLTMRGAARVLGAAQANGSIMGDPTALISGNAIAGPGKTVSGPTVGGSATSSCHPFVLPPVAIGDARDRNDNDAMSRGCADETTGLQVPCSPPLLPKTGDVLWDPAKRTLEAYGNGRVVLDGGTYALCRLRLRDSAQLVIRNSTPVTRIFLDDPAHCPNVTNAGQILVDGQARIVNCHLQTVPGSLQIYALGSHTGDTTQTIAGAGLLSASLTATICGLNLPLEGVPMVLYAPRSHVQIGGSMAIAGQVAGSTVELSGSAAVQPINALVNLNRLGSNPVLPLYRQVEYVECTQKGFSELPDGDPAQGC